MRGRLERLFARWGQKARLTRPETGQRAAVRAFIQPVLKKREDLPLAATPLGAVSGKRWLYIGPCTYPLLPGDKVACGPLRLDVQEARVVSWRDAPLYCWAMLRPGREAAE